MAAIFSPLLFRAGVFFSLSSEFPTQLSVCPTTTTACFRALSVITHSSLDMKTKVGRHVPRIIKNHTAWHHDSMTTWQTIKHLTWHDNRPTCFLVPSCCQMTFDIFGCPAALYALMSHVEEEEGQKIYHYNNARYTHEQRSYSKQKLLSMSSGCLFNIFGQLTTNNNN